MRGTEFSVRTLCWGVKILYISTNGLYFEDNECFGVWQKHGCFNLFLKEDYYV